jgi:hypothetical protein
VCPLQCRVLHHHVQVRKFPFQIFIWQTDYPLDDNETRG